MNEAVTNSESNTKIRKLNAERVKTQVETGIAIGMFCLAVAGFIYKIRSNSK